MKRILSCLASSPILRVVLAVAATLLAGCASTKIDWDSRVGTYTYDQAVTELGPPDKATTLSDDVLVAEWVTRRGSGSPSVGFGVGTGYYRGGAGVTVGQTIGTAGAGRSLRLTFGPDRTLQSWGHYYR